MLIDLSKMKKKFNELKEKITEEEKNIPIEGDDICNILDKLDHKIKPWIYKKMPHSNLLSTIPRDEHYLECGNIGDIYIEGYGNLPELQWNNLSEEENKKLIEKLESNKIDFPCQNVSCFKILKIIKKGTKEEAMLTTCTILLEEFALKENIMALIYPFY